MQLPILLLRRGCLRRRAAGRELSLRSLSRIWAGFEEDLVLVLGLGLVGWEADQEPRAALAFFFRGESAFLVRVVSAATLFRLNK